MSLVLVRRWAREILDDMDPRHFTTCTVCGGSGRMDAGPSRTTRCANCLGTGTTDV